LGPQQELPEIPDQPLHDDEKGDLPGNLVL
jgi:hypothetical protein